MSEIQFRAPIRAAGGGGSYVAVPDPARDALGATGRTNVTGTVDGFAIVGQVMPYTFPDVGKVVVLGLTKATRAAIGKEIGDDVDVSLVRDERARSATIEVPDELASALDADPAAKAAFEALAPSRRRDHARHIADAKHAPTRERRVAGLIDQLHGRG